ncbi:uncharacterized protein A4U43_C07F350 [Asparagus officinalis]|uniref:Plastocyanin-like domain-containing protein n=1 Tax=Asparagus officinalis TaxID=4686 RepID=A0A5P1EBE2_ASPOF|nr:uncharacterized protein A4U43_C07F350 [Asparagus officinalis]
MECSSSRAAKILLMLCFFPVIVNGMTRHYKFNVVMRNATRLCSSKPIVTVNGKFPGPTLYAREGDNVLVKVVNHVKYNVSIHWHGVRQIRTGWADASLHNAVPHQTGQQLRLQLHHHRPKGHPFLARPHSLAQVHRPRRHCHQAQAPRSLSFPCSSSGADYHLRRMVEIGYGSSDQ